MARLGLCSPPVRCCSSARIEGFSASVNLITRSLESMINSKNQ